MANLAAQVRQKAQSIWPGASVSARGRNWIKHQHPSDASRFMLDSFIGPIHYGAGEDQEINTAWQSSSGQWDHEVTENDFHCFVRDSVPVSYRYEDVATGHYVELTINGIDWVNDEGQSEGATSFSQVTPSIDDDEIIWTDIATGWTVRVQAQTARLAKWLDIDSLANLGSPAISGTNIQLRIRFTFQRSNNLEIWADGAQWNEGNNTWVETTNDIEFRDAVSDQPIFWFKRPSAVDNDGDRGPVVQRTSRQGNNFYAEILIPWTWLQTATFPVVIDPTVDIQINATNRDGEEENNVWKEDGQDSDGWNIGMTSYVIYTGLVFPNVTIPNSATVTVAYITGWAKYQQGNPVITWWGIDEDNAAVFASDGSNRPSLRTLTTASEGQTVSGVTDEDWYDFTSIVSIVQEIVERGSWSSDNNMGFVAIGDGVNTNVRQQFNDYGRGTAHAATFHAEYTTGGGEERALSIFKPHKSVQIPVHQLQL